LLLVALPGAYRIRSFLARPVLLLRLLLQLNQSVSRSANNMLPYNPLNRCPRILYGLTAAVLLGSLHYIMSAFVLDVTEALLPTREVLRRHMDRKVCVLAD
jgi:hypothetical protein